MRRPYRRRVPIEDFTAAPAPPGDPATASTSDAAAEESLAVGAGSVAAVADAPAAPVPAIAALTAELEQAHAHIHELQAKLAEQDDRYLRSVADSQNLRRRMEEQKLDERRFANRELVLALLGVMDNFERALVAADEAASFESLIEGLRLTMRQMQDFLAKHGVVPIEAVGKEFDPNYHEAVMRVEGSEHPDNTVVGELQRGYTMHERVLRPSMVRVARAR